ncbi:hypothetical protein IP69_18405, partial [Bosea sp. AAP35]
MEDHTQVFVGIDVAKLRNAVAVAESGRAGEVRFLGEVDAGDESMRRVIKKKIRDRLSWMRFLRFDLGGPTP